MKTKERIFYYDMLRAFAIIAVIICHVDFLYGPVIFPIEPVARMAFHDIGRIGVPIFLMISGALLLNREYDLKDFIKRRFSRIVYPFIFWVILLFLTNIFFKKSPEHLWIVFTGNPSITWYFWTLIGIYLFIPLLNSFIKEYELQGCEYFLAIWFLTMIFKTFNIFPQLPYLDLSYFAGYIGYPILGYYLANRQFKLSDNRVCILGLLMLIISLAIYVYIDYNKLGFIDLIYQNVPIIFMGSGVFLFVKYLNSLVEIKNKIVKKVIISISLCSYGMYFSHVIVIMFIQKINPKSTLLFPIMLILTVFLSWLLPYIFSKLPYVKRFSGV